MESGRCIDFVSCPTNLFGRLEWREIPWSRSRWIGSSNLVPRGRSRRAAYTHILRAAATAATDREAVLRELTADPERGADQIADRLYEYGLRGAVIVSSPSQFHGAC